MKIYRHKVFIDEEDGNGRMIGTFKDGVYRKIVRKSTHLMKKFDAWGIDKNAFDELCEKGMKEIRILDTEDDVVYSATPEDYKKEDWVQDLGHGEQMFLRREKFNQKKHEK